jgi:agmatine/peptidylarginine deiminase
VVDGRTERLIPRLRRLEAVGLERASIPLRSERLGPMALPLQARTRGWASRRPETPYRLPGEFDHHDALLLSCDELTSDHPGLLAAIIGAAQGRISIVAIVSDHAARQRLVELLEHNGLPADRVHILDLPHDSMWIRDYGPYAVRDREGRIVMVDARYNQSLGRGHDDDVPVALAELLGVKLVQAPVYLDGGNLLSNGGGLCLSTTSLLDNNPRSDRDPTYLGKLLHQFLGFEQTILLEPLFGEPTGHVDMFAMFASPDTVVIGSYDPLVDPLNADVLDRNAAYLSQIRTPRGPLRVIRVPMPTNTDGIWRSYTNGILANGVFMLPVYPDVDGDVQDDVLRTFRQTLPAWTIEPIDCGEVIPFGGALHCISKCIVSTVNWRDVEQRHNAAARPGKQKSVVPSLLVDP